MFNDNLFLEVILLTNDNPIKASFLSNLLSLKATQLYSRENILIDFNDFFSFMRIFYLK